MDLIMEESRLGQLLIMTNRAAGTVEGFYSKHSTTSAMAVLTSIQNIVWCVRTTMHILIWITRHVVISRSNCNPWSELVWLLDCDPWFAVGDCIITDVFVQLSAEIIFITFYLVYHKPSQITIN